MERREKEVEVSRLKEHFAASSAAILVEYSGLTVSEMTNLRRKFTASGVHFKVVKNRLAKLAIAGTPMEVLSSFLTGPIGVASVDRDPVAPARILRDFVKEHERCKVKSGFLSPDRLLSAKEVEALARVLPKELSIAKIMGSMQAPMQNLVSVFAAIPRQWLTVLNAVKAKKEKG